MDEIDEQIMNVMGCKGPSSCRQVMDYISDSYGVDYPLKRIRNRMNTLYNYDYLTYSLEHGKGRSKRIYSLPEVEE